MEKIVLILLALGFLISPIYTTQNYSGNSVLSCKNNDTTGPSSAFLYTCNGQQSSCPTFLIFNSEPPYNSASSISALTSTNLTRLAYYNNATRLSVFPAGKEVIVPVRCSCLGQYYQANTTYHISSIYENYFNIANSTYQGLTTCDSLERKNKYGELDLKPGLEINIPLRCACPTEEQVKKKIKYLMTYSLFWKDSVPDLAKRFGISEMSIQEANGFGENPDLFPFTTILIPLPHVPPSSKTIIHSRNQSPSNPYLSKKKKLKIKMIKIVAGLISLTLILCGLVFLSFCLFYKKKASRVLREIKEGKKKWEISKDLREEIATIDQIRVFEFEALENATKNFSSENKITGSSIHKGIFDEETLVIKKMGTDISDEVSILNKIYHFNIIKLRGISEKRNNFYLLYEYMENESLRKWLDSKISKDLDVWNKRIQIGLDIANGLNYLHSFAKPAYVHRNITSRSILLDGNLRAKIANFSLARKAENEKNINFWLSTVQVAGTRGYIAPEYALRGQVSTKIDVFAFGVVLLELITGKEAIYIHEGKEVLLSKRIISSNEKKGDEAIEEFIDPHVLLSKGLGFAKRVVKLSLRCLDRDPDCRPCMGEVASALSKIQIEFQQSDSCKEIVYPVRDNSY